jgi:hypothetical protein
VTTKAAILVGKSPETQVAIEAGQPDPGSKFLLSSVGRLSLRCKGNGIGWCSGAMWCMSHPQNYIIHCLIDHIDYMTILYYTILDVITVQWPSSISDSCVGSLSACHILSPRFWLIGPLSVFASGGCIAVNGVIAGADFRHPAFQRRLGDFESDGTALPRESGVRCQKSLTSGTNEAFVPLCAQSEKLKEMLSSPMLP